VSEKKKVEDKLARKQREIDNLEQKIKDAKVYVKALKDVLRLLDGDSEESGSESKLKEGSSAAQAQQIILDAGRPLHIDDILVAMGKDLTRSTKSSVTSALAAYARRDKIFIRTAANTFGLIELGHTEEKERQAHPPENFGKRRKFDLDDEIPF